MTEFQQWVVDAAHAHGWTSWLIPVPAGPPGAFRLYLLLIHEDPPRLILADANDEGKLPPEVFAFLSQVRGVGDAANEAAEGMALEQGIANTETQRLVGVYSWRPGDENEIAVILRSLVVGE
ncbi:MAG: hypothetical protein ACJ79H_21765 [Myxococcales bacterium]